MNSYSAALEHAVGGAMFGGIWNWKEQNKDFADRFLDLARVGGVVLKAATPLQIQLGVGLGMAAVDKAGDVVAFIADPGSVIDDWANSTKESAVSLTTSVLEGLANIHEFNPRMKVSCGGTRSVAESGGCSSCRSPHCSRSTEPPHRNRHEWNWRTA